MTANASITRVLFRCVAPGLLLGGSLFAQTTTKKEIDIRFAPLESVRPILKAALSPQGKFVLIPKKGAVLVIDTPEGILAAEQAIAQADLPQGQVSLDFKFRSGLPSRRTSLTVAHEFPVPTAFAPQTIVVSPGGGFTYIPATPTNFQTRNIGVTSESNLTPNPDGSFTLDMNTEHSELEGFVNYGSAIVPGGGLGTVPVLGAVSNPVFFSPYVNSGGVQLPIISTTRISTSIVIRPRIEMGVIQLDLMPRLLTELPGSASEGHITDLKQYHTVLPVQPGGTARIEGFTGADEEFNRQFLVADGPGEGATAIEVTATLIPPGAGPTVTPASPPSPSSTPGPPLPTGPPNQAP
jgi:hypothetical protein